MKKYLYRLLSEVLGNMFENGQVAALPKFELDIAREGFGDYSTNVAFTIAREGKFNPAEVGEIIARQLKHGDAEGMIGSVKVVKGFVNIYLSSGKVAEYILKLQKKIEIEQANYGKKILFEYSSPNTNKPLHIGHTRNDLYGVACINLLKATGAKVISAEIINDRGVHIMKSMLMYMKYGQDIKGKWKTPRSEKIKPDHFVGRYYSMFAEEVLKNPLLDAEAQELLQKWEAGDKEVRKIWKQMNEWFFEGVKETYKREGSSFDSVQYESEIYDKGRELILAGAKKEIFQKEDDGSYSVDLTDQGLDKKYLLRKDGTTIYITQDLYLWDLRNKKFHPDEAIVTTSSEQAYHFDVLKKIFQLLNYPWAEDFHHLPYEHVNLGKEKMSSRAGNAVTADDLLEMVKERVRETMRASKKIKASPDDDALVEAIAFGAIKYGYLKYDRNTKIFFDIDETVAVEGNTGPYLQYTYARIQSIIAKAGKFAAVGPGELSEPTELALIRQMLFYNDSVLAATKEFKPNLLCSYLHELAAKFNAFYDQVSVLNAESEQQKIHRLNLIKSVDAVLENGLNLLCIEVLSEM